MKLGVNLWVWDSPFRSTEHLHLVSQIKKWGGEVVEFAIEDDAVIDRREVRKVLESEGMACSVVGIFGPVRDLSSADRATQRNGVEYAKRSIDICADVGAAVFTGAIAGVGGREFLSESARRTHLGRAADNLRELGDYAAEANVNVVVEILNRYENNLLTTAKQGRELIDLVDHPAVGIHLDSFHMSIEEEDLGDAIRLASDKLLHFHGSASHRGIPGTGIVPWDQVAGGLHDVNYDGFVIIESFNPWSPIGPLACFWRPFAESPDAVAREGLAFLHQALYS